MSIMKERAPFSRLFVSHFVSYLVAVMLLVTWTNRHNLCIKLSITTNQDEVVEWDADNIKQKGKLDNDLWYQ